MKQDNELKQAAKDIILGHLWGDGDIYGRMASGVPGARPAYPEELDSFVELADKLCPSLWQNGEPDKRKMNAIADALADSFLAYSRAVKASKVN